ncbi:MAG: hypothetical protein MZW92_30590 [Comamonadaceae bacterium]|nr:hypothetical protein [Comamonadaceae bacterium]
MRQAPVRSADYLGAAMELETLTRLPRRRRRPRRAGDRAQLPAAPAPAGAGRRRRRQSGALDRSRAQLSRFPGRHFRRRAAGSDAAPARRRPAAG